MTGYASGKFAFGFCDRCSFRFPLGVLKEEISNGTFTGIKTCPECYDEDHPQNWLGKVVVDDPQSLRDPRPDIGEDASRRLYGFNPVGGRATSTIRINIGRVTVVTG